MRFVLDRYFSPGFRLYDFWERNGGEASSYVSVDTAVAKLGVNEYRLAEIDVVEDKKEDKRERPPRSEIRFNFVDEWEYAQDVTYFSLNRDFDTTKVAIRLDVSNVGNIEENVDIVEYSDDKEVPLKEIGDRDVYNKLAEAKERSKFFLLTSSLTPARVLQSAFWRYNFNWAYWVQSIVVKGEYSSDSIPQKDDSYFTDCDKWGAAFVKYMMSFKEFVIRSDESLRSQFTNEVSNWIHKDMPRGVDSLLVEGFLTRHYIPTKDNKLIDGFPGALIFHKRMKGSSLEFIYEPESTNSPTLEEKAAAAASKGNKEIRGNAAFKRTPKFDDPIFEAKIKANEQLRGLGRFKPDHPNYVACFIPYSESEKNLTTIPDFSKADRIRYTMLRGYTESKQFYSPDYSREKPGNSSKDYRRTLFWEPSAKKEGNSMSFTFYNSATAQYVDVDIQGRGDKTIYGSAANISTREQGYGAQSETAFMKIWKDLSNTEILPDILTKCSNLTEKGNIEYDNGQYDEAVKLFREAAKYGFPSAIANLGKCYYDGVGVSQNHALAMRYFEMAADKGNHLAMHYLGELHYSGEQADKNDSLAYEYYKQAANSGYAQSQKMLGLFYEKGIYVNADSEESLKWYTLAAKQNDSDALYKVGMHQVEQDSINGLSKRKLRKSPAIDYMRRAARGGNKDAQSFIVKCFAEGKYLKKSRKKSFEWMKSIAELGDDNAMMYVAYSYEKGRGTDMNQKHAYWLYKQLAEKGNEFAIAKVQEYDAFKFFTVTSPKPPGVK